jgi:hypothetical protein
VSVRRSAVDPPFPAVSAESRLGDLAIDARSGEGVHANSASLLGAPRVKCARPDMSPGGVAS